MGLSFKIEVRNNASEQWIFLKSLKRALKSFAIMSGLFGLLTLTIGYVR